MKNRSLPSLIWALMLCAPAFSQQLMSVTSSGQAPYDDMSNLIRDYLTGSSVEILDVTTNSDARAVGYFSDAEEAVGLKRGLMLTTGYAEDAMQPGSFWADNTTLSIDTLTQLEAIATEALDDVAWFRIKFRPFSDSIRFRYVFASEEYPEFACSPYNDVFGFFLSGPDPLGGNYTDLNLARIPGTNLPVTINNLHPANPDYPPCPAFNAQYYHSNVNSTHQPAYDGFTDVFIAEASVLPCATYEMLIAVADVGDSAYDTGVFLEAKSFDSALNINFSLDQGNEILPEIATADSLYISFTDIPANLLPLQIKLGGTAINGMDYEAIDSITLVNNTTDTLFFLIQPIQDTLDEGFETVIFDIIGNAGNTCFSKAFTLYIADADSLYSPSDTVFLLNGNAALLSVQPTELSNQQWTYSNSTPKQIASNSVLVQSALQVSTPIDILPAGYLLESVCLNIDHAWDGDLNIFLLAPDGKFIELSTDNGSNGDNYQNTCFTRNAEQSITGGFPYAPASAAPFSGNFQPEGPWEDILESPVNGAWKLGVFDDQPNLDGTLLNWSITFSASALGQFKYQWNTGDTTPTLLAQTPGTYTVMVTNQAGSFSKTFVLINAEVGTHNPVAGQPVFQLIPNPFNDETSVVLNQNMELLALKVFDLQGNMQLEQHAAGKIQQAGSLPNGVYLVVLETTEGRFVQKLVRR